MMRFSAGAILSAKIILVIANKDIGMIRSCEIVISLDLLHRGL